MSGPEHEPIPVERLTAALRAHAEVMAVRPDDLEAGMAVIDRVRLAARDYVAAVTERSGWGNPFVDLEDEEVEVDDEAWPDPAGPGETAPGDTAPGETPTEPAPAAEDPLRLTLQARWDFVVRDPAVLSAYAAARLREVWPDAGAAEVAAQTEDPGGALGELFGLDCWDAERYAGHGLEFAGGGWHTGPTRHGRTDPAPDDPPP